MIYFLHGSSGFEAREKLTFLVETLTKRKPNAAVVRLYGESFNQKEFTDYIQSTGLFEGHSIIILDSICSNEDGKTILLASLKEMNISQNIFIILESALDKKTLSKISRYTQKTQEFTTKANIQKKSYNIFSLSDALGERNRKKAWVSYQKGIAQGGVPEELHGILFWSVKSMLLARSANSAQEAGLNPFVFQKCRTFSKNYSEPELQKLCSKLVTMYHHAHRGMETLDSALERLLLGV